MGKLDLGNISSAVCHSCVLGKCAHITGGFNFFFYMYYFKQLILRGIIDYTCRLVGTNTQYHMKTWKTDKSTDDEPIAVACDWAMNVSL